MLALPVPRLCAIISAPAPPQQPDDAVLRGKVDPAMVRTPKDGIKSVGEPGEKPTPPPLVLTEFARVTSFRSVPGPSDPPNVLLLTFTLPPVIWTPPPVKN